MNFGFWEPDMSHILRLNKSESYSNVMSHPCLLNKFRELLLSVFQGISPRHHVFLCRSTYSESFHCINSQYDIFILMFCGRLLASNRSGLANSMCSLYTSWAARENGEGQPLTLIAWLSTSACQTGSQNITREAETRFLCTNKLNKSFQNGGVGRTYRPRAPCFNSIKNTLYVSDVSNVSTICSRSRGSIWVVNRKYFTCIRSSASARCASDNSESENMRIFSLGAYCRTCWIVEKFVWLRILLSLHL